MRMIYAIDVSAMAYREFGGGRNIETAIVTKALSLSRRPDAVVYLAFDSRPTFRDAMFPEYKNRPMTEARQTVRNAIQVAEMMSRQNGLRVAKADGYEADDVLASIARGGRVRNEPVSIISGDRDLIPLLQFRGVQLFSKISSIGYDDTVGRLVQLEGEQTAADVAERYGVSVGQWVDFRCLVGDAGDNIKGVPGVGEKTAAGILQVFESLDNMFADWSTHREWASDSLAPKLDALKERLPFVRKLFRLADDLNVLNH